MIWFLIAAGAVVGAPARYLTDMAVSRRWPRRRLPWGTILVNVTGSGLLGILARTMAGAQRQGLLYAALGTGFCGAFTTFSTFTWETVALVEDGDVFAGVGNLVVSLVLGLGAAAAGFLLA